MKVMVVGSGQSALMLAHGLRGRGIDVELFSQQTPAEIRRGPGVLTQLTLPTTLRAERAAGLDFWSSESPSPLGVAPAFRSVSLAISTAEHGELEFTGHLPRAGGIAVDPRIKRSDWLEALEDRGGTIYTRGVTLDDVNGFGRLGRYDLIVIAVGSGDLGQLFRTDPGRRTSVVRSRATTQLVLHDVAPGAADTTVLSTPHGEVFVVPTLTAHGPAHAVLMIGAAGGAFDCWPGYEKRHADLTREVDLTGELADRLREFAPGVAERCRAAVPQSPPVHTRVVPAVRRPVGWLPCGVPVLGLGDTLLDVDPGSGQGWMASTIMAAVYGEQIVGRARTGGAFDQAFMDDTFDAYWQVHGRALRSLVDMVVGFHSGALPPEVMAMAARAAADPALADRWIAALDNPTSFADWLLPV
ncbi:2-polyprenyl-6-methoxyphenol hydroxylase-like FAD-dependent oxidoreductase [Murinocardiopsis flavida]|uniref:2-polyprenyl-6-methoxyphenol hydroxylase-like FAD-dependent oxidoreductase n=1 Tax=Murinocardiopsis flavida TaxID=645275 RepID=A0A2P8CYA7_9ACTN|nr:styrene monooxygenase/indole monooxygenase family protein [Murinocardiopsis flavida]PSK89917.1 2-polyprenyl-6-methoxyphenol hydroxylase-like FAD-dependent oxidoreductase [Murinocardiopsis flavida]